MGIVESATGAEPQVGKIQNWISSPIKLNGALSRAPLHLASCHPYIQGQEIPFFYW